jgi:hypothetical protein
MLEQDVEFDNDSSSGSDCDIPPDMEDYLRPEDISWDEEFDDCVEVDVPIRRGIR